MENYFLNCNTEEAVKIKWKSLMKKWHPDINNNPEATGICFEINRQRDELLKKIYKSKGWSEADALFKIETIFSGESFKPKNVQAMADNLSEEFARVHPDKEPNFQNMMSFYLKKVFGKNILSGEERNKDLKE